MANDQLEPKILCLIQVNEMQLVSIAIPPIIFLLGDATLQGKPLSLFVRGLVLLQRLPAKLLLNLKAI